MRSIRRRERGESKVGCTIALLALITLAGAGIKIVPAVFSNNEYIDTAERLAGQAATKSEEDIRAQILAKAGELEIPEARVPGALAVSKGGNNREGVCTVNIFYTRKIDFYGIYAWDLKTDKKLAIPYHDYR